MNRILAISIGLLFTLLACSKKHVNSPELYNAKEYFPLEENSFWIYKRTLITIDAPVNVNDTVVDELKMKLIEYDLESKSYRLERFVRQDSLAEWVEFDVIIVEWNEISMHWVEDNYRFVKLTDPVYKSKSWDGNSFNILDEWNYYYSELNRTFEIDDFLFTSTITVVKIDDENAIGSSKAFEVFKNKVGPVYDYVSEFSIQAGQINTGNSTELILLKYGIE